MANKNVMQFDPQVTLDYTTNFYGVAGSGTTDTRVPVTVMFNDTTFTGNTTVANLIATTLSTSGAATLASGTVGGAAIVSVSATQTLTNKTLTTPVISTIVNTGTLTLPTSTDTLVGRATTDTLTNKTLTSPAINGGAINAAAIGTTTPGSGIFTTLAAASTITPSQTAGIVGTTTNNNANAGSVGEYISSTVSVGSAIALTTNVANTVTSISLTAGDWDVWGTCAFTLGAGVSTVVLSGSVNTTINVVATIPGNGAVFHCPYANAATGVSSAHPTGTTRLSLSGTTTVYLTVVAAFSGGTCSAFGFIGARRVR